MSIESKKWLGVVAAAMLAAGGWAQAQDQPASVDELDAGAAALDADAAQAAMDEDDTATVAVRPWPSELQPLAARGLLLDIASNGQQLYAVGDRGTIVMSADGKAWTQVVTPVRATLTALHFVDASNGWAVGHDATILHTGDGGRSWVLQNFQPALEQPLLDVLFLDAQRGFAVGAYGLIYTTQDGGAQWTEVEAPITDNELHFNAITRLDSGELFLAGEQGTLAVSSDEGASWTALSSPYEGSFFGALPHGARGVMVFGLRGNVYVSDDARGNWRRQDLGTVATLFGGVNLQGGGQVLVGLAGEVRRIGADGTVTELPLQVTETDPDGRQRITTLSGTLSAVVPAADVLLVVGENGVVRIPHKD